MPRFPVALCFLLVNAGAGLRTSPGNQTIVNATGERTEVAVLRKKLEKISMALHATEASLNGSAVAGTVKTFTDELATVLRETANTSNTRLALERLRHAQAGVSSLVKDLTARQVQLMREGDEQKESLLLGVLMARKKDSREKQLEVLRSEDFRNLPVVIAVLRANSTATPLFQQVAECLDKRTGGTAHAAANHSQDLASVVQSLQRRVASLKERAARRAEADAKETSRLESKAKSQEKTGHGAKIAMELRSVMKRDHRHFLKESAADAKDAKTLQGAIDAIRRGDRAALGQAMNALQGMLKAMKNHNNGFLVFIETAARVEGKDCPYCAAQCVDKCHAAGRSYVACLTECADAGK